MNQISNRRFNRTGSHRKALLQSLTNALLTHEQIETTLAKAKDLRGVIERLITRAKVDTLANRRLVYDRLRDRDIVQKLFTDLGPHFKTRAGGYTRVLKTSFRAGDAASMAVIQLVDREDKIRAMKNKHKEFNRKEEQAA